MKIVIVILGVLVGLLVLVALVGLVLPREHQATSRIALRQSPDTVYAVLRNLAEAANWWPEVKSVSRLPDLDGRERWQQVTSMGSIGLIVMEAKAPTLLRTAIDTTGGSPFGGEWVYLISPTPEGSLLTITENGWVSNPLFRSISRLMGHHRTLDSSLTALARHFAEPVRLDHRSDGE